MKTTFLIALIILMCFVADAQNDSAKFLRGRFISFGLTGSNSFRIDARENSQTGNVNFSNTEIHSLQTALGYGFFYRSNKALTLEVNSSLNYTDYTSTKSWSNSFGGAINKMSFKNVFQNKLFVLINQQLAYGYGYSRNYNKNGAPVSVPNPNRVSHSLSYGLSLGAMYRHNDNFMFRLTLPIVRLGAAYRKDYTSNPNSYSTYSDYNYNTSFLYSITNLQLSVLWSPNFIQTKKNK